MSKQQPTPPTAQNGSEQIKCTSGTCPPDYDIDAPCRILMPGGILRMTAKAAPGQTAGVYQWSTTSSKLKLVNPGNATVTIEADKAASPGVETVTVTRDPGSPQPTTRSVQVTIARVTFSVATTQRYGYDDHDTPKDLLDDHISVKKSDHTFVRVTIEGAIGTEFKFACDDAKICKPGAPEALSAFDLRLDAGNQAKAETTLHARDECPNSTSFASIKVHVYKEATVDVVVAKIHDSKVAATALNYATADYAAHTADTNAKLKEGVVKFNITNYDAKNAVTDVRYDLDGNGALSFDIKGDGGPEFKAIKAAMKGTGKKVRVAIVRQMKSYYYLAAAAKAGDTTVTVTSSSVFKYGAHKVALGTGSTQETVQVSSSTGSVVTLTAALKNAHAVGAPLEFPAAGWSTDPILIAEGNDTVDVVKWTIPHEVSHRKLELADVDDTTNIMHWEQSGTDYRLRYCPRTKKHETATETQWEKIPR